MVERVFRLREHNTTAGREVLAGLTTFAAMAYILAVNPDILANAGMPREALVTATALGAALSTALMAFATNLPLALAPGMGINAYFAFTLCVGMKIPWQSALGLVFINGVLFLLLSLSGARQKIIEAIPRELKVAITAGIGLFLAFIGLQNGGVIVSNAATMVALGDLTRPPVTLCIAGVLAGAVLIARRIPGAILLTLGLVTAAGIFIPDGPDRHVTVLPNALFSAPPPIDSTFFALNFDLLLRDHWRAMPVILTLLFVDLFDNLGTLIAVTRRAGLLDSAGNLPRMKEALVSDSVAAIVSSLLGTSTVVSYIESSAGVAAGGRTGLTALTTAGCFLLSLAVAPLILMVPKAAVAAVLVVVGIFMFEAVSEIDFSDFGNAVPAALTLLAMPLAFSISAGIGAGLIAASAIAMGTGKVKSLSWLTYVLAAVFVIHFMEPAFARWLSR